MSSFKLLLFAALSCFSVSTAITQDFVAALYNIRYHQQQEAMKAPAGAGSGGASASAGDETRAEIGLIPLKEIDFTPLTDNVFQYRNFITIEDEELAPDQDLPTLLLQAKDTIDEGPAFVVLHLGLYGHSHEFISIFDKDFLAELKAREIELIIIPGMGTHSANLFREAKKNKNLSVFTQYPGCGIVSPLTQKSPKFFATPALDRYCGECPEINTHIALEEIIRRTPQQIKDLEERLLRTLRLLEAPSLTDEKTAEYSKSYDDDSVRIARKKLLLAHTRRKLARALARR